MPSFFSRRKNTKDGKVAKSKKGEDALSEAPPVKPVWTDAWTRTTVEPEEVQDLLRACTLELKARALDIPFFLLPFRPTSDTSASRSFIRNYFDKTHQWHGDLLMQELRLCEPMVIANVAKWCWSRLPGGVVTWEAYELFRVGEHDSNLARDAFATFIPLSLDSEARVKIIFDFFDLLSAIAAHGKNNGLGGRKLSRLAGWWAFEHINSSNGFEGGYKGWVAAADATSHLFFAYLRSLAQDPGKQMSGISTLPMSLQKLEAETEYPPQRPILMQTTTDKVVMIVDSVSPTPFALLRRANHFQYRDSDRALKEFSDYEDPVQALTEECRRVLRAIASSNQSQVTSSKQSTGLRDATWSRFEDIGFSSAFVEEENDTLMSGQSTPQQRLRSSPMSRTVNMGRPTTPSWADFLSSGFNDEVRTSPLLLPPDKVLPPIETTRGRSSQSHSPRLENNEHLEPGELASINKVELDEAFWWVWISSLAPEETVDRKSAFGRCALVETIIRSGRWLIMEEMVKGAAPEPEAGAYIAEKKSRFGWTKRNKGLTRGKSTVVKPSKEDISKANAAAIQSKSSIGLDQQARIQAAAIQLQQKQRMQDLQQQNGTTRRGRADLDAASQKTSSVFTLQPVIMKEASSALKWANKYDKDAIRTAYLANNQAGRGIGQATMPSNGFNPISEEMSMASSFTERPAPSPVPSYITDQRSPMPSPLPPTPSPQPPAAFPEPPLPAPPAKENGHTSEQTPKELAAVEQVIPRKEVPRIQQPTPEPERAESRVDIRSPSAEPPLESSPESKAKHKKLQKREKAPGGFRKMFGRSKIRPRNAEPKSPQEDGSLQPGGATIGRRFSGFKKQPDNLEGTSTGLSSAAVTEDEATPIQSPRTDEYAPSVDTLSRVDTNDAREAKHAFSSFDQGPLEDVPAFVPESPVSDDGPPTPMPPHHHEEEETEQDMPTEPMSSPPAVPEANIPPMQDRWAQIKRDAAERVAARQSEEHSGYSAPTDNDGDTSGEETIESRVARIKARVAELTGNMDSGSPVRK